MTIIQIILIILAALCGGGVAWILRNKTHSQFLNILLSFSGAYLLGVVVIHLLPDVFLTTPVDSQPALFILLGFFIQLLIVQLTRGIEHGHMHLHEHLSNNYVSGVVFGLSIHAFLEGIPLAAENISHDQVQPLFWGIFVHKFPETFALATVLFFSFSKKSTAAICILLFSFMTPLGNFVGKYLTEESLDHNISWLIAIVCGTLIHISTTIIFEASGKAHKISIYKFLAILGGAAISLLTMHTH